MLVNSNRYYEEDGHADLPVSPFFIDVSFQYVQRQNRVIIWDQYR